MSGPPDPTSLASPSLKPRSIGSGVLLDALRPAIGAAEQARMAVAYWTVDPVFVDSRLAALLGAPGSFLCVDIHLPTSIDQLDALAAAGANVYLHLMHVQETGELRVPKMPSHLLHTKLLCFDLPDDLADIFIGSHNWTQRALAEVNLEASLHVKAVQGDPLYAQVSSRLEEIRNLCQPFDRSQVDYYKWLQGPGEGTPEPVVDVIELEGEEVDSLEATEILIFGSGASDLRRLKTVGGLVTIWATDSRTEKEFFYGAEIITASSSSEDLNSLAGSLIPTQRRYVIRRGEALMYLERATSRPVQLLGDSTYCVRLSVGPRLAEGTRAVSVGVQRRWVDAPTTFLTQRVNFEPATLFSGEQDRSRFYARAAEKVLAHIKLKVPAARDYEEMLSLESLDRRRSREDHELLSRMRLIIPKNE